MLTSAVRWGFLFLSCPLPLTDEQRDGLVRLAARAYFEDLTEIAIDLEDCRGFVRPTSDAVLIGSFYGQRFRAEIHLPDMQGTVEFLVAEAKLREATAAEA